MSKLSTLILLSILFVVMTSYQSSFGQKTESSRIFNQDLLDSLELKATRRLAWKLVRQGNIDSALLTSVAYLRKSELDVAPIEQKIAAHIQLGSMLMHLKNYKASQWYYEKAISLYKEAQFQPSTHIGHVYTNLGNAYYYSQDYKKALFLYRKNLALNKELGNLVRESSSINNIGMVYLAIEQLDSASHYFKRAKHLLRKSVVGHLDLISSINDNLAALALRNKAYREAFNYYDTNCQIAQDYFDTRPALKKRLVSGNIGKARAALGWSGFKETVNYLKEAESNLQYVGYNQHLSFQTDIAETKRQMFALSGDLDNYILAEKEKKLFTDSLNKVERNALSLVSEKVMALQVEAAELKFTRQQQKLSFNRLLAFSLGLIFLTGLVFFIITLKRRSTQLKIQKQLSSVELKNRELEKDKLNLQLRNQESDLNELSAHTAMLRQLAKETKEKLKTLGRLDTREQKTELHNLSATFTQQLNDDKIWELIQSNLHKTNSAFFNHLEILSEGSLSQKEKELCALFRLKLSDQQVAEMRAIGLVGVRVARSRIKKKLGLQRNDRIAVFLSKIDAPSS